MQVAEGSHGLDIQRKEGIGLCRCGRDGVLPFPARLDGEEIGTDHQGEYSKQGNEGNGLFFHQRRLLFSQ